MELVTKRTTDFTSVVLDAEYVFQNVRKDYQNGGNLIVSIVNLCRLLLFIVDLLYTVDRFLCIHTILAN